MKKTITYDELLNQEIEIAAQEAWDDGMDGGRGVSDIREKAGVISRIFGHVTHTDVMHDMEERVNDRKKEINKEYRDKYLK